MDCFNNIFATCDHCGDTVKKEDAEFVKRDSVRGNNSFLCKKCVKRDFVLPYHYNYPDVKFFGDSKNNSVPYLGIELEVDEGGESDSNVRKIFRYTKNEDLFFYCSHDGSIHDGFEIITQPATLEYHLQYDYNNLFRILRRMGYLSHDTSTCGLHIHFNKSFFGDNEKRYTTRLIYIINRFWEEIQTFSRRNERAMKRYSKKIELHEVRNFYKDKNNNSSHENHYYAINISNEATIEFRMFKGTLNLDTFINTLQFVHNCIMCARNSDIKEIENMSFKDLLTTDSMINYFNRRNGIEGTEE